MKAGMDTILDKYRARATKDQKFHYNTTPSLIDAKSKMIAPSLCPNGNNCDLWDIFKFNNDAELIGIAKDGHLVYKGNPDDSNKNNLEIKTKRDRCGGQFLANGSYAYVMTDDPHDKIKCWGPAKSGCNFDWT